MAIINTGMDFQEASEAVAEATSPAPAGPYSLQLIELAVENKSGEPYVDKNGLSFMIGRLEIVGNENASLNGKRVTCLCYPPSDNVEDAGMSQGLIDLMNAVGKPYEGSSFDTDDYAGLQCEANLGIQKGGKYNEIASFISAL